MKKIRFTFLILLISATSIFSQAPGSFKYQTMVRNNTGDIITNQPVSIRVGILGDSINGASFYSETHSVTTTQYGMVVLDIGRGTIETGTFENIKWGEGSHFLKLELDETGGPNYQFMGTSELLSVPYSLNSGSATLTSPDGGNYEVKVDNDGNLIADCVLQASIADAGQDTVHAVSPINLAANTPESGTGTWIIINGTGGTIADPNNPTSSFSGLVENAYTLRWSISTVCDTEYDDVYVNFYTNDCPSTVTDIDNNIYNTVQIGNQCWMKENLKTTAYNNGTSMPYICSCGWFSFNTIGAYIWLDDNSSWGDIYGVLYSWYAVNNPNGLCPTGWHVPTDDEWSELTDFIGGTNDPHGNELKSCRQVNSPLGGDCDPLTHPRWDDPGFVNYGTDDYGFSGLPGSAADPDNWTLAIGKYGYWWSSTESSEESAWVRSLGYDFGHVVRVGKDKSWGMSVRCIRN